MLKITLTFLILILANLTVADAQGESKCFQNESLQGRSVVALRISTPKLQNKK